MINHKSSGFINHKSSGFIKTKRGSVYSSYKDPQYLNDVPNGALEKAGKNKDVEYAEKVMDYIENETEYPLQLRFLLYGVAASGDLDFVKETVEFYDGHYLDEFSSIASAAQYGHQHIIEWFLERKNWDPDYTTQHALNYALCMAYDYHHDDLVSWLLEQGANPNELQECTRNKAQL